MENKKLSICIPTYNRPGLLKRALNLFLEEVIEYKVPIYISDDSTNDKTEKLVSDLKKRYPYIYYVKNKKPLGIENNFYAVLGMPDTEYRWLLGDDDSIKKGSIKRILSIIDNSRYDGIIVNACRLKDKRFPEKGCKKKRVNHITSKIYTDKDRLLEELGWHTTFMSTIVYHRDVLKNFRKERYKNTIFPHFVLFYDYLGRKEGIKVFWDEKPSVFTLNIGSLSGANWFRNIIKIFTKQWYEAVFSLPDTYSEESKQKCVKNHDRFTGVFSPLKLLYIRSFGYLNIETVKNYEKYIRQAVVTPKPVVYLTSIFPVPLAALMREIYLKIKGGH